MLNLFKENLKGSFRIGLIILLLTLIFFSGVFATDYSTSSTNSTLAGTNVEHNLKWTNTNLSGGGYEFYFCNGSGEDNWCIDEKETVIANETSFYNSTEGNESEELCQYANSATATDTNAQGSPDYATGSPDGDGECSNYDWSKSWGPTDWSIVANLTLNFNTSVYATNFTVFGDYEMEWCKAWLFSESSQEWVKIFDSSTTDCNWTETFSKTDYLTNNLTLETCGTFWTLTDAVQLCGETLGTAPPKFETLEYNNINVGDKYIFFASDDLQPGWMVDTGVNVSKYILDNGLAYIPSLSVGDNVTLNYYYTDSDLDAFFDEYYTKSNFEIAFQGETGANDEMQNLSYQNVTDKLQRMYDVLETGLGTFYDVNSTISPGCTWNYSTASLQAYPDNNISMGIYCYFDWVPIYNNWKEEAITDFYWIPENTAPIFDDEGVNATLRSLANIQSDCIKNLNEKGICTVYFHVQDFQDPINETRYQRLEEIVSWVKNNQTLKEMGVVNNVTYSTWFQRIKNSNLNIKNYDDYYNYSNTTAEIIVLGKSANVTSYQIFNATNSSVKNYTESYMKFYGVNDVNLTFKVGQPITESSNVGYRFDNITITANESKWVKDDFVGFNSSMCNANYSTCWSNVTKSVTSTIGETIYWKVSANDSSNNENFSSVYSYVTTSSATSFSITLNSPANETLTDDNTPDFNFTVSGSESSYSCELFINDSGYGRKFAWDISGAVYDNINISTQDIYPMELFFKSDGTKLYEIGAGGDKFYQYICSDAWNLSSCSYNNINISTQDGFPSGLFFKSDGTKLYEIGAGGDKFYQYICSDAWNLSSCSYNNINISTQDGFSSGLFFKSDGTKLYEIGADGDKFYQYICSDAWNLSSCSYNNINISTQDIYSMELFFKSDGTKLYEIGADGDKFYQYICSDAWNLSSCSYNNINISTQDGFPRGLFFKSDGIKLYEIGDDGNKIYQYSLSVSNNTPTIITANHSITPDGVYNWYINCTSDGITNQSEIREITIDTNTPPTVGTLSIATDPIAPGVEQLIKVNVTDVDGNDTIDSATLICWAPSSAIGDADDWNHLTNSTPTNTSINSTTLEFTFSLTTDNQAINGTWTCNITANDTSSAESSNTGTFTMSTRVGISLEHSSMSASGGSGTDDNAFTENANTITHDGNININISINGTDLTYSTDTIGVGNVTYYLSDTAGSSTPLTGTSTSWITDFTRGTYPDANTTDTYYWIDIPTGLLAGAYTGDITLISIGS